ncbi:MAG: DJ-1/PfpI family protein [Cyanobacteriota bacterium]
MHVTVITCDGFNEIDSLIAYHLLNRVKSFGLRVTICAPTLKVTSMNGLVINAQTTLEEAGLADAVIVGSGMRTQEFASIPEFTSRIQLNPENQIIAGQCSGVLLLQKLGLLSNVPVCSDLTTRPCLQQTGVKVLDQPFFAAGNLATAGGCLASIYLASWVIGRFKGIEVALRAISYIAPVGEKDALIAKVRRNISPYLCTESPS